MPKKTKQNKKQKRSKKVPFGKLLLIAILLLVCSISIFYAKQTISRKLFYQSYVLFVKKTKTVLFPTPLQKGNQSYLNEWLQYTDSFSNQYKKDLSFLVPTIDQVRQAIANNQWTTVTELILLTRQNMVGKMKEKKYYTQTIMMEDLLSLILEMETSILEKDDTKLMEQYQDFNSKYTYVIPAIIKSDVVKIGNLVDSLYKQALFGNMEEANNIYQELLPVFINGYRDYQVK